MKRPRPQDYDPNYKKQIKAEPIDISQLTPIIPKPLKTRNHIRKPVSSMVFEPTSQRKQSTPKTSTLHQPNVRPERSERVPSLQPSAAAEIIGKREIKRHSFEFYRDQLPKLKRLKAEFMMQGVDKSMSAMVREAVDTYIEAHSRET